MASPSPTIVFEVDLTLLMNEDFGPRPISVGMLNPDRHTTDQTAAAESIINRRNYRSTFIPGQLIGDNRVVKHGDTFTEYGLKAVYLKKQYGIGVDGVPADRQLLRITDET